MMPWPQAREAQDAGRPLSIGILMNAADLTAELLRRNIVPDIVTDQTPAHDPLMYVPQGMSVDQANELRGADREKYLGLAYRSMGEHVKAMVEFVRRGAVVFDYGNNLRQRGKEAGVEDAFSYPGFVPAFIRPLFCWGKGPFRWAALSGDAGGHLPDGRGDPAALPREQDPGALDEAGAREDPLPGPACPDLLAGLRRAGQGRAWSSTAWSGRVS